MQSKRIGIIGGGIGGLASAVLLARAGHQVSLFEKNPTLGGVCNIFSEQGFTFDTGPSWYLMPEVFEEYFRAVGEHIQDHLTLVRLDPAQRAFFDTRQEPYEFSSDFEKDKKMFEKLAPGSLLALEAYFMRTKRRYGIAIPHIRNKDSESISAYLKLFFSGKMWGLGRFSTLQNDTVPFAASAELREMLLLPALFLGTMPWRTPGLFNFLSYADFGRGVWYPMGGMYRVVEALVAIGKKNGVKYHTSAPVHSVEVAGHKATGLLVQNGERYAADVVLSNADRFHTEGLLPSVARDHTKAFWHKQTPTFSAMLLFLGVDKKLPELAHHNFLYAEDWKQFGQDLEQGKLSANPSVYVAMPSATDPTCAPEGMENMFVLIPTPSTSTFSKEVLDRYADGVINKIISRAPGLKNSIILQRRWYPSDFGDTYNSFKSSAMGLAHTQWQTAPFRPTHKSRRLDNLYFVGSTTNPGIGVPTCMLSAERVVKLIATEQ